MPGSLHLSGRNNEGKGDKSSAFFAEDGFTLIEILSAVTILVFLMGSVFSLFSFGMNIYNSGTAYLDLQQNARIAADFIIRELRYANTLQVPSAGEIRYYLPGDSKRYTIKQKNEEIVYLITNTENKIAYNIFTLSFNWDEQKKILHFTIECLDGKHRYNIRSAVCLQNLRERR